MSQRSLVSSAMGMVLLLQIGGAAFADEPGRFVGRFASDKLSIELKSDDGQKYTGVIHFEGKSYPLTARQAGDGLAGTFQSDEFRFRFIATPVDDTLDFLTGGRHYALKKQQPQPVNPPPNPLGNDGSPTAPPQSSPPATTSSQPPTGGDPAPPQPNTPAPPQQNTPAPQQQNAPAPQQPPKDPLAYRVHEMPGGTIATFENWQYGQLQSGDNCVWCDAFPEGHQRDFVMRTAMGTPDAKNMAQYFTYGPQLVQGVLQQIFGPVFRHVGKNTRCTCGGDEAMVEQYEGTVRGTKYTCRVMYVKRKDIAVAVMGIGTDGGMKEFGRAIEIVAQSINFKESAIDPALVGTWVRESYMSSGTGIGSDTNLNFSSSTSITIYPNGTFTERSDSTISGADVSGLSQGGSRGRVIRRGNVLTFHYDNGKSWSPSYQAYSNGVKFNGLIYVKQ